MAKAAKSGSTKANRNTANNESSTEPEKDEEEEELTEDGQPVTFEGGVEVSGEALPEKNPEQQSAAPADEFVIPEEDREQFDDKIIYRFKKKWDGAMVNVTVAKFDGDKQVDERNVGFYNEIDADAFILKKRTDIRAAKEIRMHQKALKETEPLPFTPRYGEGVDLTTGELKITCFFAKSTVIVPAELADHVLKWLNGRAVGGWCVDEKGLAIVTYPCAQRQVFTYNNGKVYQAP
jgi:hypothetical protein